MTKSIAETFNKDISTIRLAGKVEGVKTARELVENRITHKRQKKLDWEVKK